MTYTKILFSAIVGAVIGYITNWLAIKMLFRPHEEKRIFGIKIPFTPGLIPKEQKRIAKSVGDAVGNHLLTKEAMVEALKDNEVDNKFKQWVNKKVGSIIKKNISIKDQLRNMIGVEFEKIVFNLKNKLSNIILKTMRKDDFKLQVEDLIVDAIKVELKKSPKDIMESSYYHIVRKKLLSNSIGFKNSTEFRNYLEKGVQKKLIKFQKLDKSLNEVIPLGVISSLKVYIYNRNYDISMGIKDLLNDEKVQLKLQNVFSELISSNLNPMVAMFLNPTTIYNKVHSVLNDHLDKEETQKEVALFVNDIIDRMLKLKVSNIVSGLSEDAKVKNAENISDFILKNILEDEVFDEILLKLEDKIKESGSIEEILVKANINSHEILRNIIGNKMDSILSSQETIEKIAFYTDKIVDKILENKICDITEGKEEEILSVTDKIVRNGFNKFIKNEANQLLECFDISKIVEDRINTFEVSFAEKIILDIASKELSAITWLGALLGFIMGLVSSLVAMM
ncbi:DUF445 domain-containing protein [Clostridium botulinum]|uniref:DUF445 family protein n=1 Tax=Clostridium botulinum TaxID=1491 RepID=A0A9Q1UXV1_CLOBO|nr:DUF445 domain-containing protein [Clostridium botulinum]AEB77087.1 Protein of unknown function (DUF445) superfamily [Clostridium botulinum BKT015925]KEI00675.1 hypothetical protein Z953_09835 [Clostridium botulinum D str. 16868]KEI05870.1 hypothetical protein Y848_00220 [Clostridium botulinum C/D str. Sp77]KLU75543.1 hypothetical protein CBC3_08570 [Clostridium botulinum V891]KOA78687.1 hypothetical protein ADU77_05710 [Clostridium botulinum]